MYDGKEPIEQPAPAPAPPPEPEPELVEVASDGYSSNTDSGDETGH